MISFAEYVKKLDELKKEQTLLERKIEYRKVLLRKSGAKEKDVMPLGGIKIKSFDDSILNRLEYEKTRVDEAIAFLRNNAEIPPKESEVTKVD